jgi:hypothetical protein
MGHSSRGKLGLDFSSPDLLPEYVGLSQVHASYEAISFRFFSMPRALRREVCAKNYEAEQTSRAAGGEGLGLDASLTVDRARYA